MPTKLNGPLERKRERLEVSKLELEVRYIKRSFSLQVFNTLLLICVGIVGFYFFQRPQVAHLEEIRSFYERQHLDNMVAKYFELRDAKDKASYISHLKIQYPNLSLLGSVEKSIEVSNSAKANITKISCNDLDETLKAFERTIYELDINTEKELMFGSSERRPGPGPVFQLLRQQKAELDIQHRMLLRRRADLKC